MLSLRHRPICRHILGEVTDGVPLYGHRSGSIGKPGGGALAAGGGGIALGTTILGATTLGMGLLVGGIIFSLTGRTLSDKADKAMEQMETAKNEIEHICAYLTRLHQTERRFEKTLSTVDRVYQRHLEQLGNIVILNGKTDWEHFTEAEKVLTKNAALLVGILFKMCKVQLVLVAQDASETNKINSTEIESVIRDADSFLADSGLSALA